MLALISSYLFRNKKCPLPGLGSLQLVERSAAIIPGEHRIAAPHQIVEFRKEEFPADGFIRFIADRRNISEADAAGQLNTYCTELRQLGSNAEQHIPDAGKFFVNEEGELSFHAKEISSFYLEDVPANRVIHPNDSHQMIVGDRETSTSAMTEFYTETLPEKRSRWWIWAAVLAVIAAAFILYYVNDSRHNSAFGNAGRVEANDAAPTYSTSP